MRRVPSRYLHTSTHRTYSCCVRHPGQPPYSPGLGLHPISYFTRRSDGSYFSCCKRCNQGCLRQARNLTLAESRRLGLRHSRAEWLALLAGFAHCPGCGRDWATAGRPTRDHIVPVDDAVAFFASGGDSIGNIRPLCQSYNSRKYTKSVAMWMPAFVVGSGNQV
jgi:hypothetical protein